MKKFYFVLLSFIFSISGFGQVENHHSFGNKNFPKNKFSQEEHRANRSHFRASGFNRTFLKDAYQEQQRLDSITDYIWENDEWLIDYKEEFSYNENNLISEYRNFLWNLLLGEWELNDLEDYEYNAEGNLLLIRNYELNELSLEWFADWKRDYYYDDNNRLLRYDESLKDAPDEEWYLTWRRTFAYNENNRLDSILEHIYTTDWMPAGSINYTYDDNGNLLEYEEHTVNDAGEWVNEEQGNYSYDDNNRLLEIITYNWDEADSMWIETDREIFTYEENNNVEIYTDYNWNETENDWVPLWKEEYTYDNTYPYSQLILPFFYQDDLPNFMNHQLTSYQNFSYVDNEWVPLTMGNFYFSSDPATNVSDIGKAAVHFYPNPADQQITFKFDSQKAVNLNIYNLAGNVVQSQQVVSNKPVNIEELAGGLYLFRLTGERNKLIFRDKILVK